MRSIILLRAIDGLFCVMMLGFAAVQYNDPDVYFWMPLYFVAAVWAGVAAYRPERLRRRALSALLALCLAGAAVATVVFWPTEAGFWHREVWWQSETAREGMGVMILTVSLVVAALTGIMARTGR